MENRFQDILRKGVSFWNEWRKGNPDVVPDLAGVNLSKQNLSRINLSRANLAGSTLNEAILYESDLRGARLNDSDLRAVNMSKAILNNANLGKANLSQAFLVDAKLENCYLRHAILTKANLFGAYFASADMQECDLREAILYQVNFSKTDLTGANFTRANLKEVDLAEAILERAYLSQAILEKAILRKACLDKANIYKGDLRHADLFEASLTETVLFQSDFEGANLEGAMMKAANLQESNLKDTVIFRTNLSEANLSRASVSGGPFRKLTTKETVQNNLNIINSWGYRIATDTLAAAQRVHSLLHNPSAAQLIPNVGQASTLILGINADAVAANILTAAGAVRVNGGLPVQIALPPFLPDNLSEFLRLLAGKVDHVIFDVSHGTEALRSLNFLLAEMTDGSILPIVQADVSKTSDLEENERLKPLLAFDDGDDLSAKLGKALYGADGGDKDIEGSAPLNGTPSATRVIEEPIDVQEKPEAPLKEKKAKTSGKSPKPRTTANRPSEPILPSVENHTAPAVTGADIAASLETEEAAATTTIEELADALDTGLAKELEADLRKVAEEIAADETQQTTIPEKAEQDVEAGEAASPAKQDVAAEEVEETAKADADADVPETIESVTDPEAAPEPEPEDSDAKPGIAETEATTDKDDDKSDSARKNKAANDADKTTSTEKSSTNGKAEAAELIDANKPSEDSTESAEAAATDKAPEAETEKPKRGTGKRRQRRKKSNGNASTKDPESSEDSATASAGSETEKEQQEATENSNSKGRRKKRRGKKNKANATEDNAKQQNKKRLGNGKEPKLPGLDEAIGKTASKTEEAAKTGKNGHSHLDKPVEIVVEPTEEDPVEFPKKRSRVRMFLSLLILLAIAGGALAAWYMAHTEMIIKVPKSSRSYVYLNDRLLLPTSEETNSDIYHVQNLLVGDYTLTVYPTQLRDIKKMEFTRYKQYSTQVSLSRSSEIQELDVQLEELYSVRQVADGIHPYLHPNGNDIAYYRVERNQRGAITQQALFIKNIDDGEEREIRIGGRNFYRYEWGKPIFEADSDDLYMTAAGSRFSYPYQINTNSGRTRLIPKPLDFQTKSLLPMGDQSNFLVEGDLFYGDGSLISELDSLKAFRNAFFPVANRGFMFLTEDIPAEGGKVLRLNCNYYDTAANSSRALFQIFKSVNPPFISASQDARRVVISEYSGATLYYFTQLKLWQDGRWANLTTPILDGNEALSGSGDRHKIEAITNLKGDRIIYEYNDKIFLLEIPATTTMDDLIAANLEK